MTNHSAISIGSARSRAWIPTLLRDTRLVVWTITIDLTFRFAFDVGIAQVIWRTSTGCRRASVLTTSIQTARIWIASIFFNHRFNWFVITPYEWITNQIVGTRTDGIVVGNIAFGTDSTSTYARIATLEIDTSLI